MGRQHFRDEVAHESVKTLLRSLKTIDQQLCDLLRNNGLLPRYQGALPYTITMSTEKCKQLFDRPILEHTSDSLALVDIGKALIGLSGCVVECQKMLESFPRHLLESLAEPVGKRWSTRFSALVLRLRSLLESLDYPISANGLPAKALGKIAVFGLGEECRSEIVDIRSRFRDQISLLDELCKHTALTKDDQSSKGTGSETKRKLKNLSVNVAEGTITHDGVTHSVPPIVARVIQCLIDSHPQPVSLTKLDEPGLRDVRPHRIRTLLPASLRKLVKSARCKGTYLDLGE